KDYESSERYERAHHYCSGVFAEHGQHGNLHSLSAAERVAEHGRLCTCEPYVEADENPRGAGQKRNAPAVCEKLIVAEPPRERKKYAPGKKEADGRPKFRKHAVPGA